MAADLEIFDIKSLQEKIAAYPSNCILLPKELDYLVTCFIPGKPESLRMQAYRALSSLNDTLRNYINEANEKSQNLNLSQLFRPAFDRRLMDVDERSFQEIISFHNALFLVDVQTATTFFLRDGYQDIVLDSLDMFPQSVPLHRLLGNLVALASGHKASREHFSSRTKMWLEVSVSQVTDRILKAALLLAQVKYTQLSWNVADPKSHSFTITQITYLFDSVIDIVLHVDNILDAADAVEAIVFLSSFPSIKERVVANSDLLERLYSHRSITHSDNAYSVVASLATVNYGITVLTSNLTSYRSLLSEEEEQLEKLKALIRPSTNKVTSDADNDETQLNDDSHVKARCRRLLSVGAVDFLSFIARSSHSHSTLVTAGKCLLNFSEDRESRGRILQHGGGRALLEIIKFIFSPANTGTERASDHSYFGQSELIVFQALAKLSITASPMQVFGPNESASFDAIKPFSVMLQHQMSKLLQQFEALMALTNLSSSSSSTASRIATSEGLLSRVESLLLEENVMIRRASMELLCNLIVNSESVFLRYSGEGGHEEQGNDNVTRSRLHVILALSDVEDFPTRLAASGALATLSTSSRVVSALISIQKERSRLLEILKDWLDAGAQGLSGSSRDASFGIILRGVVCLRNLLLNSPETNLRKDIAFSIDEEGLTSSILRVAQIFQDSDDARDILIPTVEIMKTLLQCGIKVPATPM